jgi:predicted DNA-binding transcriptional regulator AlpA
VDRNDQILTAQGVADILKVSRRKVYDLWTRGELTPRFKLFQKSREGWRWTRLDVDTYLDTCIYSPPATVMRDNEPPDFCLIELTSAKA